MMLCTLISFKYDVYEKRFAI